jgi:hypothetical protein
MNLLLHGRDCGGEVTRPPGRLPGRGLVTSTATGETGYTLFAAGISKPGLLASFRSALASLLNSPV